MSQNEYTLLGELIYNNEDCYMAFRLWKVLDESHKDEIPQMLWNWKLLEKAIRLMTL
jgi:hypothetical protein